MPSWGVLLNGVYLSGACEDEDVPLCDNGDPAVPIPSGDLSGPPDGLGLPELRISDATLVQRDGVKMFSDWYTNRKITLENVVVCADGCPECPSARRKVRDILQAWNRQCDETELVLFTDCHGTDERPLVGPYGVVGRPRQAIVTWESGPSHCATLTLRFDSLDHRLYVLDSCGEPGSGEKCVELISDMVRACRYYDECTNVAGDAGRTYGADPECPDGWTYENQDGGGGNTGPQTAINEGTLPANPIILTLDGTLTNPQVENLTNGDLIEYSGTVRPEDPPVIINTRTGTATQGGRSRTHLLSGDVYFQLDVGENTIRLLSFGAADDGSIDVCWRDSVEQA